MFPWLLRRQTIEIDVPTMERWWRGRVTGPDAVTKATAARDFACLRSPLSRAVEWKLIEPPHGHAPAVSSYPQGGSVPVP